MSRGNLFLLVFIGNILAFEEIPGLRWVLKGILLNQSPISRQRFNIIHARASKNPLYKVVKQRMQLLRLTLKI